MPSSPGRGRIHVLTGAGLLVGEISQIELSDRLLILVDRDHAYAVIDLLYGSQYLLSGLVNKLLFRYVFEVLVHLLAKECPV